MALDRSKKTCKRDGCEWTVHAKKLCVRHHREEFPPVRRTPDPNKPRKPRAELKRTEMKRTSDKPKRTTATNRNTGPKRTTAKAKPKRVDDIPAEARAVVLARCESLCEACGFPLGDDIHIHHRKRRRDGGHVADNLVALHGQCHVVAPHAVHQNPAWAKQRGLIVSAWADPAEAPLTLPDGRAVLLHPTEPAYLTIPDDLPLAS